MVGADGGPMFSNSPYLRPITRVPTPVRERTPEAGIPPEVEAIVSQAISKEKDDRFQNADQFIHAIDSLGLDLPGRRNR